MISSSSSTNTTLALGHHPTALRLEAEADFSLTGRFRCYADCDVTVLASSSQPPRCLGSRIKEDVTEYLSFGLAAKASLSKTPHGKVALSWVGKQAGATQIRGREVFTSEPVVGVLKASYQTRYSRWELPAAALALPRVEIVAICRETLAQLALNSGQADAGRLLEGMETSRLAVTGPEEPGLHEETTTYTLTVLDYCTGDPVPGAKVLTSYGNGTADGQGQLTIGPVPVGAKVDLRVSAPGYQDSHLDALHNDYFIA